MQRGVALGPEDVCTAQVITHQMLVPKTPLLSVPIARDHIKLVLQSSDCPTFKKYDALVKKKKVQLNSNPTSHISKTLNPTSIQPQRTASFEFHNTQGSYFEPSPTPNQCSYSNAVKTNKSPGNNEIFNFENTI